MKSASDLNKQLRNEVRAHVLGLGLGVWGVREYVGIGSMKKGHAGALLVVSESIRNVPKP
jgi:hypothetical protein